MVCPQIDIPNTSYLPESSYVQASFQIKIFLIIILDCYCHDGCKKIFIFIRVVVFVKNCEENFICDS